VNQRGYGTGTRSFTFPTTNPFLNGLVVVLGFLALGAAMLLGLVVLAVFLVSLFVLAGVVGLRLWWLRRKLEKRQGKGTSRSGVIEGEYRVVDLNERRRERR
jgi:predicted lysophospholipase L1 biosynthesis ABC-type transport system permease subunit